MKGPIQIEIISASFRLERGWNMIGVGQEFNGKIYKRFTKRRAKDESVYCSLVVKPIENIRVTDAIRIGNLKMSFAVIEKTSEHTILHSYGDLGKAFVLLPKMEGYILSRAAQEGDSTI